MFWDEHRLLLACRAPAGPRKPDCRTKRRRVSRSADGFLESVSANHRLQLERTWRTVLTARSDVTDVRPAQPRNDRNDSTQIGVPSVSWQTVRMLTLCCKQLQQKSLR